MCVFKCGPVESWPSWTWASRDNAGRPCGAAVRGGGTHTVHHSGQEGRPEAGPESTAVSPMLFCCSLRAFIAPALAVWARDGGIHAPIDRCTQAHSFSSERETKGNETVHWNCRHTWPSVSSPCSNTVLQYLSSFIFTRRKQQPPLYSLFLHWWITSVSSGPTWKAASRPFTITFQEGMKEKSSSLV